MAVYPINLVLKGKSCAVIGGGKVAERKVHSLLSGGAKVTVYSSTLTNGLVKLADEQLISVCLHPYKPGKLAGFFLVICATNDSEVNRSAALEAKQAQALVNVVDAPELCDFTVPASLERGDLLFTVSTGGHSPKLARLIKEQLAKEYGEEYSTYLLLLGKIRDELKKTGQLSAVERGEFWQKCLDQEIIALLKGGAIKEAEEKIRHAAGCIGIKS